MTSLDKEAIELVEVHRDDDMKRIEPEPPLDKNEAKFISRVSRAVVIPAEDLEGGKRAIAHYLAECRKPRDRIYLFHSVHLERTSSIGGTSGLFHSEQLRRQIQKKKAAIQTLQDNLEKYLDEHDIMATFYARDGEKAGANIVRFANEKNASLIIMARKEHNFFQSVLGTTSEYVTKHSGNITVTIVPSPLHRYRLERHDSDTSCPGDLTFGNKRKGLKFLKPTRRRLNSEPSALNINNDEDIDENSEPREGNVGGS